MKAVRQKKPLLIGIRRPGWLLACITAIAFVAAGSPVSWCMGRRVLPSCFPVINTEILDNLLARTAREWGEGCSLLLMRNDEILYEKSFGGFGLGRPIPIASASKWLNAAVILTLVDEGKLNLADPVSRFVPQFTGDKGAITVRQLLAHTSGLPMSHPALARRDITLAQAVAAIARAPLNAPPGQICSYGDSSMQVAGRVAEIASGIKAPSGRIWKDLFASRLSVPLGMTGTSCEGSSATDNPHLAGGGVSTATDYAKFLLMLLSQGEFHGRRILSKAAVTEMFRDQTAGAPLRFNPFQFQPELFPGWRDVRYGIGTWLERIDDATGSGVEVSSPGAFGFCPWIDFERDLIGVFAAASGMEKAFPAYLRIKALVRTDIP